MNGVLEGQVCADPKTPMARLRKNKVVGDGFLSLLDQAIVSGTNFATTVVIGRAAGEEQLGLYSLGFTIIVLALGAQESLITLPYTVFRQKKNRTELENLRGVVAIHLAGFSLIMSLLLFFGGGLTWLLSSDSSLSKVLLVLAATATMLAVRDFVRRIAFADFQIRKAIKLDLLVCSLQLSGIFLLVRADALTAVSAHSWLGAACGIVSVALFLLDRPRITRYMRCAATQMGEHWRFGRWVLLGQLVGISNGYLMHWLLAIMLGAAHAGIFAACMSLVYVTNPVVIGLGNYLAPSFSALAAESGNRSLLRPVLIATLLLSMTLSVIFVPMLLFGEQLLLMLYGENYAGYGTLVSIVACSILLRAIGSPPENGLRAMNHPEASVTSQSVTLAVSLFSALVFIPRFGLVGAASCLLAGLIFGNVARWSLFLSYVKSGDSL